MMKTFVAVGSAANLFPALSLLNPPQSTCASGSPKVNQAYVWGLAKSGSNSSAAPQQSQIKNAARCSPSSMRQGT